MKLEKQSFTLAAPIAATKLATKAPYSLLDSATTTYARRHIALLPLLRMLVVVEPEGSEGSFFLYVLISPEIIRPSILTQPCQS
jgi:hypothetical protein